MAQRRAPATERELPLRGIAAHRGGCSHYPENTLAAFAAAARVRVQQIEFDVRRCASGEIVVLHDASVDRTTDGEGLVSEHYLESLRELDAGSYMGPEFRGERIPTLDEVLEVLPRNVWLNIQLKLKHGTDCALQAVQQIRAHDRIGQVILACGTAAGREARVHEPDIHLCDLARQDSRESYIEHSRSCEANFIQFHHLRGSPTKQEIEAARKAKLRVNHFCEPRTEQHPDALTSLFEAGVDFPLVDDIEAALAITDSLGIPRAH
jgi:glycerophosphoryl diester phosphodiesterase